MAKANLKPHKGQNSAPAKEKKKNSEKEGKFLPQLRQKHPWRPISQGGKFCHAHQATSGARGDKPGYHLVVGGTPNPDPDPDGMSAAREEVGAASSFFVISALSLVSAA